MRSLGVFGVVAALMVLPAAGQEAGPSSRPRPEGACGNQARPDRLRDVTDHGDLVLDSGGLARLAGLRLPEHAPRRQEALAWLRAKAGMDVVVEGPSERDRWSRLQAVIRLREGSPPADLGQELVAAGLAIVDPEAAMALCQMELLRFEQQARQRSLGVWEDDRYKPIEVSHAERLQASVGQFVLVEGRIRSIGERSQRIYLNFGEHWAEDFTIVIPRKTWKLMGERGLDAAMLKGQRIRARGILEPWQGTALTLVVPEMIERLAGERLPR
jgi:Staphylococcal nuclease homologue